MNIMPYLRERAPLYQSKEELIQDAVNKFGVSRNAVQKKIWNASLTKKPLVFSGDTRADDKKIHLKGLSESEIREKHDAKFIMGNIVKKLEKGIFITDTDFIKQCNIKAHVGYRQVLEDPEFRTYKGKVSGITYWSHPESIAKMKEEGILS